MIPRRPHAAGAFSIVEMMAAILIFSLAVMAILEAVTASLRSTTASLAYTQAVFLAQQKLEETLLASPLSPGTESGDFGSGFPRHRWAMETEEVDAARLYRVRLDVRWSEFGRDRQFTVSTLAANRQ